MTYRDETLILREKLGDLLTAQARLEGRVRGLTIAIAEHEERAALAQRALESLPLKRGARSLVARVVGGIGGLLGMFLLFGGGCVMCAIAYEEVMPDIDEERGATLQTNDGPGARAGCRIRIYREDVEDPCTTRVRCGGQVLYDGIAQCDEPGRTRNLQLWDHAETDGTPVLVLSERHRTAIIRDQDQTHVLTLHD